WCSWTRAHSRFCAFISLQTFAPAGCAVYMAILPWCTRYNFRSNPGRGILPACQDHADTAAMVVDGSSTKKWALQGEALAYSEQIRLAVHAVNGRAEGAEHLCWGDPARRLELLWHPLGISKTRWWQCYCTSPASRAR